MYYSAQCIQSTLYMSIINDAFKARLEIVWCFYIESKSYVPFSNELMVSH